MMIVVFNRSQNTKNMKNFLTFLALALGLNASAQVFEIPAQRFPFTDIIEWKGQGAILMCKDPNKTTRQIDITLVGNQETSIWEEKFTPKNEKFYYITSENARYVYFLDNLELENGKVYFSQLNSAGNMKTTNVSFTAGFRKLGITTMDDLEVINIVVTDKALVHHFRYKDKKNKSIKEFAGFITHHNMLPYVAELGSTKDVDLKNEDIGLWDYIGFTGDQIYFAARTLESKKKGWTVKEFTSKGKYASTLFLEAPTDLIAIENTGFGTTGKYYLKEKYTMDKGLLVNINDKFYMLGGRRDASSAELVLYEMKGAEWEELNTMKLNYFIEKKALKLGVYPLNEGIGYHLDHNGYDKASIIYFKKGESAPHNSFTERTIYNPTSVFNEKEKTEFTVTLPGAELRFDTGQLNTGSAAKFELIK